MAVHDLRVHNLRLHGLRVHELHAHDMDMSGSEPAPIVSGGKYLCYDGSPYLLSGGGYYNVKQSNT